MKNTVKGIVVYYANSFNDEPDTLYFYKNVSLKKRKDNKVLTLKSFSHYLDSVKWKSLESSDPLYTAIKGFNPTFQNAQGKTVYIFHSVEMPSRSKLDSVPSIQARKKYKALEASEDFKARAASTIPPVFEKGFNCSALIFNHKEMTNVYDGFCSSIDPRFTVSLGWLMKLYMEYNLPPEYTEYYLFKEPITYSSGVSVERDYLDEYSVYIGKRFFAAARKNISSSLYCSLKENNPEHFGKAILQESFTQFILFVQEKRLELKDLNKDMLIACAAYVFKNYTYDKMFANCTKDMYARVSEWFSTEADKLVTEFKKDPAKVYKEYVKIYNTNRTAYPPYALRRAPGVIEAYTWSRPQIDNYKRLNGIKPKKYSKRSWSQDNVRKKSRQEAAVRVLKEEKGMNISQIHRSLQTSEDATFHMGINTVRKIFKSLEK